MRQKTFLQYWQMVFCHAARRVWDAMGAWGTALTILAAVIAAWYIEKPKSLKDIGASEAIVAAAVFAIIAVVILIIAIAREPVIIHNAGLRDTEALQKAANGYLGTQPNISIGQFHNEITPIAEITRTSEGTIVPTGRKETVERFYVEFTNTKKPNVKTENAEGVYVKINFYDAQRLVATHDKPRWWGPIDMFDERDWYRERTISANGHPEKLYLVIRRKQDEKLYIFGLESHKSVNFIVRSLELKADVHYIHIRLSAVNLDPVDYWIRMEKRGREQPLFTLLSEPPASIKDASD